MIVRKCFYECFYYFVLKYFVYWLSMIGILMIGGGSGAMKPCVAPFGEDQFTERHHPDTKDMYFDMFYLLINVGALISAPLTPMIREKVCYSLNEDQVNDSRYNQCFVGAFGTPGILMASALLVFMFGKNRYTINPVTKNAIPKFINALKSGIKNYYKKDKKVVQSKNKDPEKLPLKNNQKKSERTVFSCSDCDENTRTAGEYISKIWMQLLPVPIFWAIFDQAGSLWTLQALEMNGWVKNPITKKPIFYLLSDQAESINPFCVVIFLVLTISWKRYGKKLFMKQEQKMEEDETDFDRYVPVGLFTPIKKISYGFLLTSVSIYLAAFAQKQIDSSMTMLPNFENHNEYGVRIRNAAEEGCVVHDSLNEKVLFGEAFLYSERDGTENYPKSLKLICDDAEVLSVDLSQEGLKMHRVPIDVTVLKSKAIVEFMNTHIPKDNEAKINFVNVELDEQQEFEVEFDENFKDYGFVEPTNSYKISSQDRPTYKVHGEEEDINISVDNQEVSLSKLVKIKNYEGDIKVNLNGTKIDALISDGVEYTIVQTEKGEFKTFTDIKAREVSINWQFFIYIVITIASLDIFFSIFVHRVSPPLPMVCTRV